MLVQLLVLVLFRQLDGGGSYGNTTPGIGRDTYRSGGAGGGSVNVFLKSDNDLLSTSTFNVAGGSGSKLYIDPGWMAYGGDGGAGSYEYGVIGSGSYVSSK